MMKKVTLFLASSSELKDDREQFELFIYRKCKIWFDRGIFLHLDIWEDFLDAMSAGGLQSEYNKTLQACDIFVLLAFNKVGKYTAEEFSHAFGQFAVTQKPFIFTYFKTPTTTQNRDDLKSLWAFEDRLKELHHYETDYHTIEGLREHFSNQLDKLAAAHFLELQPDDMNSDVMNQAVVPSVSSANAATVSGQGHRVYQDIKDSTITDSSKTYNIDKIDQARFE